MYLYFDNQGVLKEIVNDKAVRQGDSNLDKIYFFIASDEPDFAEDTEGQYYKARTFEAGRRTFYDVEGNVLGVQDASFSLDTVKLEIPYNKKRELKYFQYFQRYECFVVEVPDDLLNDNGTVGCSIKMVNTDLSIFALGFIAFNVEKTATNLIISIDEPLLSIAQWNYLISNMLTKTDIENGLFESLLLQYTDTDLSKTSEHPVQNKVITEKMGFRRIEGDIEDTLLLDFYNEYGLGGYVVQVDGTKYLFSLNEYDPINDDHEVSCSFVSLDSLFIYEGTILTSASMDMYDVISELPNRHEALLVKDFTSNSQIRYCLSGGDTNTPIFKLDSGDELYIGLYVGTTCEIESLNGPERWYSNNVSYYTTFADFMVDANRNDYALQSALAEVYKPQGSATVATLNGLTITESMNAYVYNMSDSGNLVNEDASTVAVSIGDNVALIWNNGSWKWDRLSGFIDLSNYVDKTTAQTISGMKTFTTNTNFLAIIYTYDIIPVTDDTYSLGSSSYKWKDLYLGGTAYLKGQINFPFTSANDWILYRESAYNLTLKFGTNTCYTFQDGAVLPRTTADLGSTTYAWKDLYLSGQINFNSNNNIRPDGSSMIIYTPGSCIIHTGDGVIRTTDNGLTDLGTGSRRLRDIYVARNLTDGTNSYTVAESFGVIFNKLGTGSTVIKWSELCLFDLTANTTFTFETPKSSSVPEYKAIINNNGAGNITLTFTGVTNILCNDDNCTVTNGTNSTLVLPTGVSIELSVLDNMMVAINFEAQ